MVSKANLHNSLWLELSVFIILIASFFILHYKPEYNIILFTKINSAHNIFPIFIYQTLTFIAESKLFILPMLLLILVYIYRPDKLINVMLIIIIYYLMFIGLKHFIKEIRPYMLFSSDKIYVLKSLGSLTKKAYQSFPSGHAGVSTMFIISCLSLFNLNTLVRLLLIFILTAIALCRVLTGWHWPSDIIAGYLLSYIIVKVCLIIPLARAGD